MPLPLKAGTFSENMEVTGQRWLSDSRLESQVEGRFHCEKCRASPAVTPYLWHIRTTQGRSDKRRPSLTLAGFSWHSLGNVLLFYLFCRLKLLHCVTVEHQRWLLSQKSTHQRQTPPTAQSILHQFEKTQQNCHHKVKRHGSGLNTNAPRQTAFDVRGRENSWIMSLSVCF